MTDLYGPVSHSLVGLDARCVEEAFQIADFILHTKKMTYDSRVIIYRGLQTYAMGSLWSVGSSPVYAHLCWLATVEAFLGADQWLVGEWNAKGFGLASEAVFSFSCEFLGLNS